MPPPKKARLASLHVQPLEPRLAPSTTPPGLETFDTTPAGPLPSGWSQWSGDGSAAFAVSGARSLSPAHGLAVSAGISTLAARSWLDGAAPADVQVGAAVYLDTIIPAQVIARGSGLGTAAPSYYALSLTRGLQAQLVRVTGGAATTLGTLKSSDWFAGRWVRATLDVTGGTLRARVYRPDTGQYLNDKGQWQAAPAWALQATDTALAGPGQIGLGRPGSYTGTVTFDDFGVTQPGVSEPFDQTPVGSLPGGGWAQWSSTGDAPFAATAARAVSPANGLAATTALSSTVARAWPAAFSGTDVQASADVYLNSLVPAQVFARGTNLSVATPSYYAASVTRGLQVQILRVQNGAGTVLGQQTSADWVSDSWVRLLLSVSGDELRAQVYRLDTGTYLNAAGTWQTSPAWALDLTDTALAGPGQAGVARPASYAGSVVFDDFAVTPAAGDGLAPAVALTSPAPGGTLSGTVAVQATAADNVGVVRAELVVDGVTRGALVTGPYQWGLDTTTMASGPHTLSVLAYDAAGNVGRAAVTVTVRNDGDLPQPTIPRHLTNIRIAELAYTGTPIDGTATSLLQNDVDLVIADARNVPAIAAIAPKTPQLLYTNLSTLYGSLLTDWGAYADANGLSRESAFYHVAAATPYSGGSPSSQPVEWLWSVAVGTGTSWADRTEQARRTSPGGVTFGGVGQSLVAGYPERSREIDVALLSGAGGGWQAALEYPTQVDAAGNPTAWAPLPVLTDTTAGLARTGQVLFDPPADWKPASINGSAPLYFVRFRTTAAGTAPTAASLFGADYTGAGNGPSGVIPAFDYAADSNHDGYLSNAEYSHAAPGFTARFAYQGRALYGSYGEMRFATAPGSADLRAWAVGEFARLLARQPQAAGLFVDNSNDVAPAAAGAVRESVSSYPADYAALLNAVAQAVAPAWLLANTAGGDVATDALVSHSTAYFEEFALRPLSASYQQFENTAALVAHRTALRSPAPYAVLDALPTGGSAADPRTQVAALAEYYLVADPQRTFLDPFGGSAPASSWSQHFFGAITYDVGKPLGAWSVFASGADPNDSRFAYRVYGRQYGNALVLYKPLSSTINGSATGTLSDDTATAHALGGSYRALRADGTLGPVITSVTLRNGEGAILVKASV